MRRDGGIFSVEDKQISHALLIYRASTPVQTMPYLFFNPIFPALFDFFWIPDWQSLTDEPHLSYFIAVSFIFRCTEVFQFVIYKLFRAIFIESVMRDEDFPIAILFICPPFSRFVMALGCGFQDDDRPRFFRHYLHQPAHLIFHIDAQFWPDSEL